MESLERPTTIYALIDPDTGEVHYIGKTIDLWRRYARHLLALWGSSAKVRWLKDLQAKGKFPGIWILERVATDEADARERRWIAYWRSQGAALVNHPRYPRRRRQGLVKKTYVVEALYVDLIERYAQDEGVELKDVVNLAFHEFFERRRYLSEGTL